MDTQNKKVVIAHAIGVAGMVVAVSMLVLQLLELRGMASDLRLQVDALQRKLSLVQHQRTIATVQANAECRARTGNDCGYSVKQ